MEVSELLGLDSVSSLTSESKPLSARSTSSISSMEDALGGLSGRKKKGNTLSRLKKLKKHVPSDIPEKVEEILPSNSLFDIKDLTASLSDKPTNGNDRDVHNAQERVAEVVKTPANGLRDGMEGISPLQPLGVEALLKKPSPSPRIRPRRIRALDGAEDGPDELGHSEGVKVAGLGTFESLMGLPPLAKPTTLPSLDDASNLSLIHAADPTPKTQEPDPTINGFSKDETSPHMPRERPRQFGDVEVKTTANEARTISTEGTEKRLALTEEWSCIQDEHRSTNSTASKNDADKYIFKTDPLTKQMEPKLHDRSRLALVEDPVVSSSADAVYSQQKLDQSSSAEKVSEAHVPDEAPHLDEDSDGSDLIVIPDNSRTEAGSEVRELAPSSQMDVSKRVSALGHADSVEEPSSSLSSLTDVSKLMSPLSSSTPSRTPTKTSLNANAPQSDFSTTTPSLDDDEDDDEDIVISTFAHKENPVVEETIIPRTKLTEESVFNRITPTELAAELEDLSNNENTLTAFSVSDTPAIIEPAPHANSNDLQEDRDHELSTANGIQNHRDESGNQSKLSRRADVHRSTAHILETPPTLDSTSVLQDDADCSRSVAQSEPLLGETSTSRFMDTNRSFMSTGALSLITTRTARNRSYLSGGVSKTGSMLCKDEMERFFPDRKVKIFITTWNMCEGKVLPDNLEELLLPEDCDLMQDMYVIGSQESSPDGSEWEVRLQEVLGPSHVLLHSATHGVLRLLIFIRRDLIWFCSVVEDDTVSTRAFSMIKTKGAVAASFTFFGTSFLFINSHFTAGDEHVKERIADYDKIIKDLQLPVKVPPTRKYKNLSNDITSRFDYIFWCGDFNFRLAETRTKIENWAGKLRDGRDGDFEILLQHDQLRKTMSKKSIFRGFHEAPIQFLPTYKYDIGGDVYDTSVKARVPSYTDRVLFKSRASAEIHNVLYNACNSIKVSDHKPVYAMFEVKIRPGKDDSLTSGGVFSRDVFIEANKRRVAKATMPGTVTSQKSSTVCSVM